MAQAGHSRGATECGRGPGITKRGNSRVSRDPRRFADCLRPRGATRLNENNPSIATPSTNGLGRDKAMVTLRVNGEEKSFDGDPSMPLLWYLRDELGLSGTKFGCGAAQRGAAAEFGAGQPQLVAQIPQQRHRRIAVETLFLAIDAQCDHGFVPPEPVCRRRCDRRIIFVKSSRAAGAEAIGKAARVAADPGIPALRNSRTAAAFGRTAAVPGLGHTRQAGAMSSSEPAGRRRPAPPQTKSCGAEAPGN